MGSLAMRGKRLLVHGWPKNPLICWSLRFDICHVSCIWSMDSRTLNGSTWRETSSRTFEYRELRSYLDTTVWTFRKIQLINQQTKPSKLLHQDTRSSGTRDGWLSEMPAPVIRSRFGSVNVELQYVFSQPKSFRRTLAIRHCFMRIIQIFLVVMAKILP